MHTDPHARRIRIQRRACKAYRRIKHRDKLLALAAEAGSIRDVPGSVPAFYLDYGTPQS